MLSKMAVTPYVNMTDGLIAIPMFLMIAGIFLIAVVTSPKKWVFRFCFSRHANR
jgi:hypothetical protein